MYLKNTSDRVVVVINTVVGKVCIKPGEVINLKHKLLPPLSAHIKKATEEDYNNFRNPKQEVEKPVEKPEEPVVADAGQDDTKLDEASTEEIKDVDDSKDEIDITDEIKDENAADFIKKLFLFNAMQAENPEPEKTEPEFESKGEEPETDALEIKKTDSNPELEELESQLEELKAAWVEAKPVRKKDKIHKQIKELQKQIDKIKKDMDAE